MVREDEKRKKKGKEKDRSIGKRRKIRRQVDIKGCSTADSGCGGESVVWEVLKKVKMNEEKDEDEEDALDKQHHLPIRRCLFIIIRPIRGVNTVCVLR